MNTYLLPESVSDTHDGDEWAIAAILGNRVVALRYLSDVEPAITLNEASIRQWLLGKPLPLRELLALGPVSIGMIGADGFLECWRVDS